MTEGVMNGTATVLLGLSALLHRPPAAPEIDPADFRGWFRAATEGTLRIPREVEGRARRLRYVFIGGFGSERMPGYFAQNAGELRALGVPRGAIHLVFPSSGKSAE